jgi:ABC-type sugar transport system permease subunit/ABC-type glycerol-3-phosphate transport system substrate-binding protein
MNPWKLIVVLVLGAVALWWLAPPSTAPVADARVVEIRYMSPSGPVGDALADAIRVFEEESRRRHAADPSKPIYKVISGQNASRDQTADPTRFLVGVAGGLPPDVIYFDRFAVSEWAARGAFERLDGFLEADRSAAVADEIRPADFYASCWNEVVFTHPVTRERGLYGIPVGVDSRALLYNKDLLVRAGYVDERGEARPPRTWEELEEMAVRLTERDASGRITRLGFVPNYGNSWLYLYGWMNGGEFMSEDGRTVTLNDPRIVEALAWIKRIYDKLGGAEAVYAFQSSFQAGDLDPFVTGKVAMKIDGYWQLTGVLARYARLVDWGAAPPPLPAPELAKGREPISWAGGWCHAIPSTARQKAAAWELIRFLASQRALEIISRSEQQLNESQGIPYVPRQNANRAQNAWLVDTYIGEQTTLDPRIRAGALVYNDLLERSRYRPVTPVGQLLWNFHISAMESAIFGKQTPQQALDEATGHVQRQLDRVLDPPHGPEVRWGGVIAGYALLLVVVAWIVFRWDASPSFRARLGGMLGPLGRRLVESSGAIEGVHSPLFRSQWKGGWICAAPWIVGFILFSGGPLLFSIVISFCDYDILNPARFVGLDNYRRMAGTDPLFWKSLWNTLYMVLGIPIGMAVSLGIALLLNLKIRGVAVWRTLFYLPAIVPAVASSILWIWILNPNSGLLNAVLASVGITGPNWLQDESTSKPGLILMGLWGAGGGMIIWLAGLKGISETYYEAAAIDGAGPLRRFFNVTIPLLSPYIFFNLIMGLIGTFQIFTQAFIMTQGGPVNSTLFYAYHLFNNAFRYLQMGYASALAWLLFAIIFALTILQMRLSKRWVHYESD